MEEKTVKSKSKLNILSLIGASILTGSIGTAIYGDYYMNKELRSHASKYVTSEYVSVMGSTLSYKVKDIKVVDIGFLRNNLIASVDLKAPDGVVYPIVVNNLIGFNSSARTIVNHEIDFDKSPEFKKFAQNLWGEDYKEGIKVKTIIDKKDSETEFKLKPFYGEGFDVVSAKGVFKIVAGVSVLNSTFSARLHGQGLEQDEVAILKDVDFDARLSKEIKQISLGIGSISIEGKDDFEIVGLRLNTKQQKNGDETQFTAKSSIDNLKIKSDIPYRSLLNETLINLKTENFDNLTNSILKYDGSSPEQSILMMSAFMKSLDDASFSTEFKFNNVNITQRNEEAKLDIKFPKGFNGQAETIDLRFKGQFSRNASDNYILSQNSGVYPFYMMYSNFFKDTPEGINVEILPEDFRNVLIGLTQPQTAAPSQEFTPLPR